MWRYSASHRPRSYKPQQIYIWAFADVFLVTTVFVRHIENVCSLLSLSNYIAMHEPPIL